MKDSKKTKFFFFREYSNSTSTSMIIFDFFFDSIEQVQFILFGYSFGNIGLIKFKPVDDVKLYFEHTSTIVESN